MFRYLSVNDEKKLNSLLLKKNKIDTKQTEILNILTGQLYKQVTLEFFQSSENPLTVRRDDLRNYLNERKVSFTYVLNAFEVKTFVELKDKIFKEAAISLPEEKQIDYIDRDFFNKNPKVKDDSHLEYQRGYFITAVIGGMGISQKALDTVIHYCKDKGYELVILPMKNAYKNRVDREDRSISDYPESLHPYLESSFFTEYIFNDNIRAKDFLLLPQTKKPLTGLREYGKKQYSLIVASPKQDMETIPVAHGKHPHMIHSTGTLSLPDAYFNDRVGRIATEDHVMGGLIVEIQDSNTFYLRQIQFDEEGGFNDIDFYYSGKKKRKASCSAVVWGDLHNKLESEEALRATIEWTSLLSPEQIYLQDSVDMHSVNPHHSKSIFDRIHKHPELDTLPRELRAYGEKLIELNSLFPGIEIVDIPSNHPYFLIRYLDDPEGKWLKDRPENVQTASELFYARINKIDTNPIRYWIRKHFPQTDKFMSWPEEGTSIELTGCKIEVGSHGHIGQNGTRGSKAGIRLAYNTAVHGHSHGPYINGPVWGVGVMHYDHGYNIASPSSWLSANVAIYANGQRQMQIIPRDSEKWKI